MTVEECEEAYKNFLSDLPRFENALKRVISEWVNSCEHYLTNENMNRIAWLGQASMCLDTGVPSRFCGGYNLLSEQQKEDADAMALKYLNEWREGRRMDLLTIETVQSKTRSNLY